MNKAQKLIELSEYALPGVFNSPVEFIQFLMDNFQGIDTRQVRQLGEEEVYWEFRFKGNLKIYKCIIKEKFAWQKDPILRQKSRQFE